MRSKLAILALILTALAGFTAYKHSKSQVQSPAVSTIDKKATENALNSLLVKDKLYPYKNPSSENQPYNRAEFGTPWKDVDHNGCDTRNDILNRDLVQIKHFDYGNKCIVKTGVLNDPYSGKVMNFKEGKTTSMEIQIDHVVALADAWETGAQNLSANQKLLFANDPMELLAVNGALNTQKSNSDAAKWLPPNKNYQCTYIAKQINVKKKWHLWITTKEKTAMQKVLNHC